MDSVLTKVKQKCIIFIYHKIFRGFLVMTRKIARDNTFLLLFEGACKNDETPEEIFNKAVEIRDLEVDEFVKSVFFGTYANIQIIDEEVPLADVPKTGDPMSIYAATAALSGVGLAVLGLTGKKKEDEE